MPTNQQSLTCLVVSELETRRRGLCAGAKPGEPPLALVVENYVKTTTKFCLFCYATAMLKVLELVIHR
jgi:hypothetical protein